MSSPINTLAPGFRAYRGRIAPSPTGLLHLGHARTFWTAQERARAHNGVLVLRVDDLDAPRCRAHFVQSMFDDMRWFGLGWREGPDVGGPKQPYVQSERMDYYRTAFEVLRKGGFIYPCTCSRKDIHQAASAPHVGEDELLYPGTCRDKRPPSVVTNPAGAPETVSAGTLSRVSWRFRVTDGEDVSFHDRRCGVQSFKAGTDFGDFVVWRHDDVPSYQLACVVDDSAMEISEVVRGADLLVSTARQVLLYRALKRPVPGFFHCPLMTDESGMRLAKRHDGLSLSRLRAEGRTAGELRAGWQPPV